MRPPQLAKVSEQFCQNDVYTKAVIFYMDPAVDHVGDGIATAGRSALASALKSIIG
jgi:hypothetical protein